MNEMTTKDDGGPAFPQNDLSSYGMGPAETNNGGMSLRDWFAGRATQDDVRAHQWTPDENGIPTDTRTREEAKYAYADAMIAARNGGAA
jgi:hypothetical protein